MQRTQRDKTRKNEELERYVATSLIAHVKRSFPDTVIYLHADDDDTPKQMYEKMGFETIDRRYEYLRVGI